VKLLLLTFYYPPDLSAGSFRAKALVDALKRCGGTDLQIDVLTTSPNRYHSHHEQADTEERVGATSIVRIPVPSHRSGLLDQSWVFAHFARHVLAQTRNRQWDVVVATSSRLMTASLGAFVARRCGGRLYLDIRDLFVDTMTDVFSGSALRALIPLFRWTEHRTFKAASRINLVSPGFVPYVEAVVAETPIRCFTNGIDNEFMARDFLPKSPIRSDVPLIVYAGNMGEGQGLHHVLPEVVRRLRGKARFRLIGDGGRRAQLESALAEANATSVGVEILDPVSRSRLCDHYGEADILFLHLNSHAAFEKVLPSKIFEYAATGKPILAGVPGYAARFLRENVSGCAVFSPCSADGMIEGIQYLSSLPARVDREAFCCRFSRTHIMESMARDVLSLGDPTMQAITATERVRA
jgi:glycosyltransferase involved in cell wall biosynthesis